MERRNIILLSIDTLRADEVGCINQASKLTPCMDKFGKQGSVFPNCFSQGPNTRASLSSLMSSTYPLMFGDYRSSGINRRISFVELLKKYGYSTAGFHSNPFLSKQYGYKKGFDIFYDALKRKSLLSRIGIKISRHFGDRHHKILMLQYLRFKRIFGPFLGTGKKMPYVSADTILNLGKGYLEKVSGNFFLWLHFMDVHGPYPKSDKDLQLKIVKCNMNQYQFSQEEIEAVRNLRAERIRYVDQKIGELVDYLQQKGLYDNTAIFIASDHGEEFLEHGRYGHGDRLYDELIHVPLMTNFKVKTSNSLCENLDIPVTMLQIAGIECPNVFMGKSIDSHKEKIFAETSDPLNKKDKLCIRTNKWKLIHTTPESHVELYDLEKDPKEKTNLSTSNPDIVNKLLDEIKAHQNRKREIEKKTLLYRARFKMRKL